MPKRKKCHEHWRSRLGLVSHSKRRRMASERCEDEWNGHRLARRRRSTDKADGHSPPTSCASPRWSEANCGVHTDVIDIGSPQKTVASVDKNISNSDRAESSSLVTVGAKPSHLLGVCSYFAHGGEPDQSFQRVMGLVALTSSLKLSEDRNGSGCSSYTLFQERPASTLSTTMTVQNHVDHNGNCVDKIRTVDLDSAAKDSSDSSSANSSGQCSVGHLDGSFQPIRLVQHCSVAMLQSSVVDQHPSHLSHRPSLPRVDEPFEDSSDCDEGFYEPVPKRSHGQRLGHGDPMEPDEGVNIEEASLAARMRHRRLAYTNHVLDASLGCACSLYWQMMSNQYGIPTKMYSTEKSRLAFSFESMLPTILGLGNSPIQTGSHIWTPAMDTNGPDCSPREPLPAHLAHQSGVFAVGRLAGGQTDVQGMLGLCLWRAVHCNKAVFVFDCQAGQYHQSTVGTCKWYQYCRVQAKYVLCPDTPALTKSFAGLGPNGLPQEGRAGIRAVFLKTFGAP